MDRKILITVAILAVSGMDLPAQDTDFDLSSQRLESQSIAKVPGQKIDHKGPVLNPVPHEMNLNLDKTLDFSAGFRVKDRRGLSAMTSPSSNRTKKDCLFLLISDRRRLTRPE